MSIFNLFGNKKLDEANKLLNEVLNSKNRIINNDLKSRIEAHLNK